MLDDRAVLAAIVYLVQAGCSRHKLPVAMFGVCGLRKEANRRWGGVGAPPDRR